MQAEGESDTGRSRNGHTFSGRERVGRQLYVNHKGKGTAQILLHHPAERERGLAIQPRHEKGQMPPQIE